MRALTRSQPEEQTCGPQQDVAGVPATGVEPVITDLGPDTHLAENRHRQAILDPESTDLARGELVQVCRRTQRRRVATQPGAFEANATEDPESAVNREAQPQVRTRRYCRAAVQREP